MARQWVKSKSSDESPDGNSRNVFDEIDADEVKQFHFFKNFLLLIMLFFRMNMSDMFLLIFQQFKITLGSFMAMTQ